jgi:hypothetical protein
MCDLLKDKVFIASFLLIVFILPVFTLIRGPLDVSYDENRCLNKIPAFNLNTFFFSSYQERFENAMMDQIFGAKEFKIAVNIVKQYNTRLFNSLFSKSHERAYVVSNDITIQADKIILKKSKRFLLIRKSHIIT